ncbi:nucleotidyltransferase family protein [Tenacibaculum sp. M341]|uniref:nucleotidyltransferase family protein n=1 Tax=Tenacibaculum sp. M341 TaxID=2530339 RepID=UPI001048EDA2|nr:nucleotidyltransferase family protein [Tenacibaculum sp. M341]TCI93521.1 nucleotidyltransferase family protein [Tenacibaculum sp. M341]
MKIAVLILAAGSASRMGKIKQLLPYKHTFLLGNIIENALEIVPDDVYVVLGANKNNIQEKLEQYPVTTIVNNNYKLGLSASIVCGVQELLNYDAILVCLGDQPKIDTDYLKEMIELFKKNENGIVASNYGKLNGVPAIFSKSFYSELLNLKGDKGAKMLLNSKDKPVSVYNATDKLLDIDTPEDYKKLIQ